MAKTLQQLLSDIGAFIDQDTTLPTGTEMDVRVNLVNQSLNEWAEAYQWQSLRSTAALPFALSATSVGLPANFKKLMSPVVDVTISGDNKYVEIPASDRFKTLHDRWVVVGGNESTGKYMLIAGMPSGASLVFDYQRYPSALATLVDVAEIPQPAYLVKRTLAHILESRSDTRFPDMQAQADRVLESMIEEEDVPSGGANNRVPDWARSTGFRIGES